MINIIKSQPAPVCLASEKLKISGDYKCGEVINRIHADFHNKCYICEEKSPSSINVEHFRPHRGDVDLKFDWNNLFFACSHCNNTKMANYDDILNCTDAAQIITDFIEFSIKPWPKEKAVITPLIPNQDVQSTAQLLNEVYNGTTELKMTEAVNIRDKLVKEINEFVRLFHTYFYETGLTFEDKENIRTKMRRSMHPESPFTAFKIWIIKSNEDYVKLFGDLMPRF